MDKVTLKEIREHCDRQCVRYGMNKDSDYYKEHYLIRELLDEINCDLEEYKKKIKTELLDKVAHELKETFNSECPINYTSTQPFFTLENVRTLVDMVIKEMKAEEVR